MSPLTLFCHLPNSVLCPAIPRLTRLDPPIGSINSSRDHSRLNAYKRECLRGFARAHRKSRYNISPSFFFPSLVSECPLARGMRVAFSETIVSFLSFLVVPMLPVPGL